MQIIVTGKLSQSAHSGVCILSKRVQKEDVRRFLEETKELTEQGDCDNVDAVLQASAGADRDADGQTGSRHPPHYRRKGNADGSAILRLWEVSGI